MPHALAGRCSKSAIIIPLSNTSWLSRRMLLRPTQRRHINHGVIVDTKVDLVSNGSGKAHGHGFIFGDVTGEPASVLVVRINEVKRRKKVVCFEFLVELVSSREVESEQRAEEEMKEKHGHGEWLR